MHDISDILNLYPQYDKVYGPYISDDGRKRIVLKKSGSRDYPSTTISYPKALKEIEMGRRLQEHETVDHHDRNKSNDETSNLIVIPRSTHSSLDVVRVKVQEMACVHCGTLFIPTSNQINTRSESKAGPFCSRRCTGSYGSKVQQTGEKMGRLKIEKTYFQLKK